MLSQGCLDVYPLFEKEEYFNALQKGRELPLDKAPGPLLELMVKDIVQQGKAQKYAMAWMKPIKEGHDEEGYWVQSEAEMGEFLLANNYPLKTPVTK